MATDPLTQAFQAGYSYGDIAQYHSDNGFDAPAQPPLSAAFTSLVAPPSMVTEIEYAPGTPGGAPAPTASGIEYAPGTPGGAPATPTLFNQGQPSPNAAPGAFNQPGAAPAQGQPSTTPAPSPVVPITNAVPSLLLPPLAPMQMPIISPASAGGGPGGI